MADTTARDPVPDGVEPQLPADQVEAAAPTTVLVPGGIPGGVPVRIVTDGDWDILRDVAWAAAGRAYAPYSGFPVGAAGLVEDGRVVVGCNVENASYGVGLCAECGMISALHTTGGGRLVAVVCVDRSGEDLMPCGRCRQLIWESGGPGCLLHTPDGPLSMSQVLPRAFDAHDLGPR